MASNEGEDGVWNGPGSAADADAERLVREAHRFWGVLP